jgi:hypothetical protein
VDALRKLHEALTPGGQLVDTQPLSPRPPVEAANGLLGSLDMREWAETVRAVDDEIARGLGEGLFELVEERRFTVADAFDTGDECADVVGEWGGTRLSRRLDAKIRKAVPPLTVQQEVRLRLFLNRL